MFDVALLESPIESPEQGIEPSTLGMLRTVVTATATRAGLEQERIANVVMATNEVATNSLQHGGGKGTLRLWRDDGALIIEIRDAGAFDRPLVDRERPGSDVDASRGLWLANQLCDLVQIRSYPRGTVCASICVAKALLNHSATGSFQIRILIAENHRIHGTSPRLCYTLAAHLMAVWAGASAFIQKSRAAAERIDAVRQVAAGGTLITPNDVASLLACRSETKGKREILTPREAHVLSLMAQCMSSREIASQLAISYVTVRSHIRSMGGKLAVHSKLQAVAKARELALID